MDGYWTLASGFDFAPLRYFTLRLVFDVERGIPDFIGEGEFCPVAACLLTVSVVKLTCFAVFEVPFPSGVEGTEGSTLSKLGLLGLLDNVGMAVGIALGFFALELGYRRMDLTRSNLLGLRKRLFGSDFGALARLFVVADFVKALGVGFRFGFDGDRDKVGICVAGFVTLAARAREACVGVLIEERKLDWERGIVGVVGMILFSV
jgi:hypothetical protein